MYETYVLQYTIRNNVFLDQESILIKIAWIRLRIENFKVMDLVLCPPILRPRPKEDKIFGGTTWIRVLICNWAK
jgi:hypothetical protein